MGDTAQTNLNSTMKTLTSANQQLINYLESIAKILEDRGKYAPQRELAKWIKQGGQLNSFTIQGRGINAMLKAELQKNDILYMDESGGKILIRDCDKDAVRELNRKCLIARSDYYQEIGLDEFENAVADTDIKDKELLKVSGLSYMEMECLRRKCNDISRGFMLGTKKDPETGLYDCAVYGRKVCEYDPERTDFCEAGLAYALSLYGPNEDIKQKQLKNDIEMAQKIADLRNQDGVHYLVSEFNSNDYIMFSKDAETGAFEFQYGQRYKDKEGRWNTNILQRMDTNDPDFDVELIRCTDRIKNKVLLSNDDDFNAFLHESLDKQSERLTKTADQRAVSQAESKFADKINVMIKDRYFSEGKNADMSSKAKFDLYRRSVKDIAVALKTNTPLNGYKEEDMDELKNILKEANVNIREYDRAISAFTEMDAVSFTPERKTKEEVKASAEKMDAHIRKEDVRTDDDERER